MISIIVAIAENGAIGKDNKLIWHISEDLKRFKSLTSGHTIIMGRKTFESLPKGALPNRQNIVLTHDKKLSYPNCIMLHSVEEIIEKYQNAEEEVFIIGGSHLYQALLPFAKKLYLTQVHQSFEADVYFPKLNIEEWEVESKERHEASEKNAYAFSFVNLIRQ